MASRKKPVTSPSTALSVAPGPDARQIAKADSFGFSEAEAFQRPEGAIVRTMSPMIMPKNWPMGANGAGKILVGVFTKLFETNPTKDKKGEGCEIIPEGADMGVALPVVATLKTGLEILGVGAAANSKYIGRTVAIQLMPNKIPSKKGQDAWNFVTMIYPEKKNA